MCCHGNCIRGRLGLCANAWGGGIWRVSIVKKRLCGKQRKGSWISVIRCVGNWAHIPNTV